MTKITPEDGFAIVTGAGSGLGRAMAKELCDKGFVTVGTGRRADALQDTAAQCGGLFRPEPLDVSDGAAVRARFAALVAELGPLAILINNAAVYPKEDFLAAGPETVMQSVAINLGGVVHCTHAALSDMTPRGEGRILNVSTFADLNPLPASAGYSVSKGAARIFTRAVIADVADRWPGIVIGDWMPGMLQTGMGIPDGLAPETAAGWGVKLALTRDPLLTGALFEMNREVLPPRGLKGKIKDALTGKRKVARVL